MKTIIAGSRFITDYAPVAQAIKASGFEITEVVSGHCRGVDQSGERWARLHDITVRYFPANWRKHGRAAGPIRNREMAAYADALIAVLLEGQSKGTVDMIEVAKAAGLKVYVHEPLITY